MSCVQPFFLYFGFGNNELSRMEFIFLEAKLFVMIYGELKEMMRKNMKNYFQLMNFSITEEDHMLETNFIRAIINDILLTQEYNVSGVALYTNTPEDVIYDLASGRNSNPTLLISQKIINLHRSVRPILYEDIMNKIRAGILGKQVQ